MSILNKQSRFKELYNKNIDILEIMKELKLSHATFYRWIKKVNYKLDNDLSNNQIKLESIVDLSNINVKNKIRN